MHHWLWVPKLTRKNIGVFSVFFSSSWTSIISQVDDRCQTVRTKIVPQSGHIHNMWFSEPPTRLGANGDSGRVLVRCISVRWVSSLLIPSLFPTHNKARSWPGLVQRPCLSDLWHNTNLCPPWRGASLRHRLLLWEGPCFQSERW